MGFGFRITDLIHSGPTFNVNATLGVWAFSRVPEYDKIVTALTDGRIGTTYLAVNNAFPPRPDDSELSQGCDDICDICLILSYLKATCITPASSAPWTEPQFLKLGDRFIPPRAIRGLPELKVSSANLGPLLEHAFQKSRVLLSARRLRLFLSHWISSMTCFSIEDIFLSLCVAMDIVKQCEIAVTRKKLEYFQGMKSASKRFGISELSPAFRNMRNDLIHEGTLSGSNNRGKTKHDCSEVIADLLNWIDRYLCKILDIDSYLVPGTRWRGEDLESFLPSFSLPI